MFKHLLPIICCLIGPLFFTVSAESRAVESATGPHIQVTLVSEHVSLVPGKNWLGVYFEPEEHWHTYWRNPGDSGEAPTLNWTLPEGLSAGDIQWPLPHPIPVAHLMNYGYEGPNLLMVPIEVDGSAQGQSLDIAVDLSWLVCKEDCIPGWATLSKTFNVTSSTEVSEHADVFRAAKASQPGRLDVSVLHEVTEQHLVVSLPVDPNPNWQLLPFRNDLVQHAASPQVLQDERGLTFILNKSEYYKDSEDPLSFLLSDGKTGFYLTSTLNDGASKTQTPLALLMLMALLGGILLNLMPCVLPVLSIKALALQQHSVNWPVKLAYLFGVLVSFWVFAAIVIGIKQSGEAIGWGFQMQHPQFIAALAYLFVFITMMLVDAAPTGSRLSGIGQGLIQGNGFRSQFFTGVLAVVVATPCTAPFMATAMGVALASDTMVTIALFTSLGLGLALPLSLISWLPALSKWLPKPGPWMTRFRQFLAFPMLLTLAWLVWVYLNQTSAMAQFVLLIGLTLFACGLWLLSTPARLFQALAAVLMVGALSLPWWQNTPPEDSVAKPMNAFSEEKLQALIAANQVVLVNMTADWCITCKVNEQVAFNAEPLQALLAQDNVHYLVGDWTNKNEQILSYLNRYERSGVPLYVVYAGQGSSTLLPQILTADMVIEAIQRALGELKSEE